MTIGERERKRMTHGKHQKKGRQKRRKENRHSQPSTQKQEENEYCIMLEYFEQIRVVIFPCIEKESIFSMTIGFPINDRWIFFDTFPIDIEKKTNLLRFSTTYYFLHRSQTIQSNVHFNRLISQTKVTPWFVCTDFCFFHDEDWKLKHQYFRSISNAIEYWSMERFDDQSRSQMVVNRWTIYLHSLVLYQSISCRNDARASFVGICCHLWNDFS